MNISSNEIRDQSRLAIGAARAALVLTLKSPSNIITCIYNFFITISFNTRYVKNHQEMKNYKPPVALAIRFKSTFLHLLTAMAPASTKYLRHKSSIPPVVSITLAPEARIFSILSLVMSDSLLKIENKISLQDLNAVLFIKFFRHNLSQYHIGDRLVTLA